ncbi:MAG: FAD:protein FMN transferase [Akkermansiaceae bacterium]
MKSTDSSFVIVPDARGVRKLEFFALGTPCAIQFREGCDENALKYAAASLDWLSMFEAKYSRFRPESLVSRINSAAGREAVEIDAGMHEMLEWADRLYRLTDGILDASMLPLLRVWDWKKIRQTLPASEVIEAARAVTGWHLVQRDENEIFLPHVGMGLDFGGFGKEYAVDQLVDIAGKYGIKDVLIDLGRDIYGCGGNGVHPFWHVGLEDAANPGACWGGVAVSGFALCSSGDYVRRFEHNGKRYGHIIDPRSGWPVANGMRSVSVCAPTCLQAGIYSTAIFVMGRKEGMSFAECAPGIDVSVQDDDGFCSTRGFVKRQVVAA